MILLLSVIVSAALFSVGFVAGCFWSANFLQNRVDQERGAAMAAHRLEGPVPGALEPSFSFGLAEGTPVR